jgi:hypothetical protein
MAKSLRCLAGRHHWRSTKGADGDTRIDCEDCGKLRVHATSGFDVTRASNEAAAKNAGRFDQWGRMP